MKSESTKTILYSSDNPQEAFDEYRKRQAKFGEKGIAFADVRQMIDPPKTEHRYVVLRIVD